MPDLVPLLLPYLRDCLACLRFYSRLPLPVLQFETDPHGMLDFARSVRTLPVAGALIGLTGALALWLAAWLGLPVTIACLVALATLVLATGAMHEDGLADFADGLGGGATRERKLEIMKDSRLGTYGVTALVLGLALRSSAMVAIAMRYGLPACGAALIATAALSRTAGLLPLVLLDAARADGAGHAATRPLPETINLAAGLATIVALLIPASGMSFGHMLLAIALALAAAFAVSRLARRHIGGQTGDVAGAAQQAAEIAALCALLIGSGVP